jgi:hypothetical protein
MYVLKWVAHTLPWTSSVRRRIILSPDARHFEPTMKRAVSIAALALVLGVGAVATFLHSMAVPQE